MALTFSKILGAPGATARLSDRPIELTLCLNAEERTRSRHRFTTLEGQEVFLRLPRGTVLQPGDVLEGENHSVLLAVQAQAESILIVQAATPFELLRAAYHLGNRHVPLELRPDSLRLTPDPVLQAMLEHRGLKVAAAVAPFFPEAGAYSHSHSHQHDHGDHS